MALRDRIKKTTTEFVETTMDSLAGQMERMAGQPGGYVDDGPTPFVGFEMNERTGEVIGRAHCPNHSAILGGPGSGKTRKLLVPQICTWDGPVFAVTAKGDLAEFTAAIRALRGGPLYMMDFTGQVDWSQLPEGVVPLKNDPTAMLVPDETGSTDDSAWDLATLLTQIGTLGMGGGKPGGGDSAFWMTLALGTLACLLQAGHGYPDPDTGEWVDGGGIDWVMRAILDPGTSEGDGDEADENEELDLDTPNWDVAATRAELAGSAHATEVEATKLLKPEQRDSVGINLRVALSSWKKRVVRGDGKGKPFTPELLEDPNATLYLVSPSSGSAAGAATSVVESIVAHWTQHSIKKRLPKISMVIDECPQICPIPRLREHIALMRSYGCWFTVAAQESSQFTARFGRDEMDALFRVYPTILVLVGAIENDMLERAAWTVPPSERKVKSTDGTGRGQNLSGDRTTAYSAAELLPKHEGECRLIRRGRPGEMVKLVDFSEM